MTETPNPKPRFELGQIVATPNAIQALEAHNIQPQTLIERHARGDWGELSPEDAHANEIALQQGDRLLSSYAIAPEIKIWLITEADRSSTALLLPTDY